jgi:hypothetical protein
LNCVDGVFVGLGEFGYVPNLGLGFTERDIELGFIEFEHKANLGLTERDIEFDLI